MSFQFYFENLVEVFRHMQKQCCNELSMFITTVNDRPSLRLLTRSVVLVYI